MPTVNQNQPLSETRAAWPDSQPLKVIWGHRLLPEVGPAFKVFKEDVLSLKEEICLL